jgi:hypothetical protein
MRHDGGGVGEGGVGGGVGVDSGVNCNADMLKENRLDGMGGRTGGRSV